MTRAPGLSDNLRGAGLMAGSMAAFAVNDAFMKAILPHLPLGQAVVLRGVLATLLIGALAIWFGQFSFRFSRRDWALVLLRTGAEIGMTWFFLRALSSMPLANLHAVLQALPLTVALGAALVLHEPIGWRRFSAIAIGFVGVMLIVRPGPSGFDAQTLNGLITVGFITLRDLISRKLSPEASSLAISFITAGVITAFFTISAFAESWQPVGPALLLRLGGAAAAIFLGYLLSLMTMRVGDIGFIAPFRYTGLLWALGLGWIFFGEWPKPFTFIGAGIVVATGLFTLYRERRQSERAEG